MSRADRLLPFLRRTEGSVAIEAAFIVPIFLALMFSLFEAGWYFYKNALVENAVANSARLVMTGRAPEPGTLGGNGTTCLTGKECFYEIVCDSVAMIDGCPGRLSVEVKAYDDIGSLIADGAVMTCPNAPGFKASDMAYDPGSRYDYVLVRICYLVDTINPGLGLSLSGNADGTRSLVSTHVRRNEPYVDFDDAGES